MVARYRANAPTTREECGSASKNCGTSDSCPSRQRQWFIPSFHPTSRNNLFSKSRSGAKRPSKSLSHFACRKRAANSRQITQKLSQELDLSADSIMNWKNHL